MPYRTERGQRSYLKKYYSEHKEVFLKRSREQYKRDREKKIQRVLAERQRQKDLRIQLEHNRERLIPIMAERYRRRLVLAGVDLKLRDEKIRVDAYLTHLVKCHDTGGVAKFRGNFIWKF